MTKKEAIDTLRQLYSDANAENKAALECLIPELKESEDERIRKELIDYLNYRVPIAEETELLYFKRWIGWLEKQKYEYEVFEPIENTLEYKAGFKAGIESEKQKEQKPTESSEDKWIYNLIWSSIKNEIPIASPRNKELALAYLEKQKEQAFTHHEIDESLRDAVTHQMEDDGDVDDFVRRGIDDIVLKYAELGARWQKEQKPVVCENDFVSKPAERSEEDKTNGWTGVDLGRYLSCLQQLGTGNPQQPETINSKWFKEHCRPMPKQDWSEEDEKMRLECIDIIEHFPTPSGTVYGPWGDCINWLKSLRPAEDCSSCAKNLEGYISGRSDAENKLLEQFGALITPEDELHIKPRWKPSEEHFQGLRRAIRKVEKGSDAYNSLTDLYEQLKKL